MPVIIRKIREWNRRMKLSERMILVYMMGCFVPLLFVYIYMYNWITLLYSRN